MTIITNANACPALSCEDLDLFWFRRITSSQRGTVRSEYWSFAMTNRITIENQKAGTPESYWNVAQSNQIEGFTTDISVNAGQAVNFKINVNGTAAANLPYKVEI